VFRNHPEINLIFAEPLVTQPKVIEASQKRIENKEKNSPKSVSRSETLLMTIGHGSRDTGFNSKVKKTLSQLGENMGFGQTLTGFAGSSKHYMENMPEKFKPQRFRRVILFPFFYFLEFGSNVCILSPILCRANTPTQKPSSSHVSVIML
jgi:sirohydrochlorin ferrochelatase